MQSKLIGYLYVGRLFSENLSGYLLTRLVALWFKGVRRNASFPLNSKWSNGDIIQFQALECTVRSAYYTVVYII